MPDREENRIKVTDRRKYNADGSPRATNEGEAPAQSVAEEPAQSVAEEPAQSVAEEPAQSVIDAEFREPKTKPAADNVVSFPTEQPAKNAKTAEPALEEEDSSDVTASAGAARAPDRVAASHAERAYSQARGPGSSRLPDATFYGMANMLGVEAAMHLGLIQNPGEEARPPDVEAARHLIDMLGILQAKTRGNLTAEEDSILEDMLADLRMQFVAVSKGR